jgi:TetR/AcrR family transcriptional regulator, lmrAB and yxaGH operons repressor
MLLQGIAMTTARDQIIQATCDLLEQQGYHATGLNQIVRVSGAPKGSLYYYFPDGKEEITEAAIARAGAITAQRIRQNLAQVKDPGEAFRTFIYAIASAVETSEYRTGGPLQSVAIETAVSSERLNQACRDAYDGLQGAFYEKLIASGFTKERAAEMATFITSAIEGGTILSRTYHSGDPLRRVADELKYYLGR